MAVTHSTTVVVADDGTSPVGTDEWNADHATATVSLSGVSANKDQLLIPDTTAGAGMTIGGDTNLYRSAANTLKTDDELSVGGNGVFRLASDSAYVYFGASGDVTLNRSAAGTLKNDGDFVATGSIKQSLTKVVLDTDHTAAPDPHSAYFKTISFGGNLV